ncbi:amino acid ABC transporter permease [Granulosicoccus sp.]|nr:amino acid ABC transporter permease [Granulosicoccus sp.]MDB4224074.1 amino acid ABC transporter permease [Granulosicoccus sp.]
MTELFQMFLGDFHGKVLATLIIATQYTVYLSLTAFIGGGFLGLVLTICRVSESRALKNIASSYVWLFQSVPLLMLLFITGLGVPVYFQIDIPAWVAAAVSLTIFTSAYLAEVWRGSLDAVATGQWEGGQALGISYWRTLRLVIAPQAIRIAIPPTVGFLVQIIKGTSLAYIIDFNDVMRWGKKIANSQLDGAEPFIIFPMVALIYFCLCFPLSMLSRHLEKKLVVDRGISAPKTLAQGA